MHINKSAHHLVFVLLFMACAANAQQRTPLLPEERAAKLSEWMATNLQLTPAQQPTVEEINLRYAKKMEDIKSSNGTRMQKLKSAKNTDAAKDAELKAILTDSQFSTYQSRKEELRDKLKEQAKTRRNPDE